MCADFGVSEMKLYVVMGDGEQNEGQIWEAAMLAGKYRLNNLVEIIDRNNIQIDGFTEDVMPLENLRQKYEAFNWHVMEVDGHNIRQIIDACNEAKAIYEKPTVIIAHTIPKKGVEYMDHLLLQAYLEHYAWRQGMVQLH